MTFYQLYYVVETAKYSSISKAASHLSLAQTNLSATITSLEKELGFFIFSRNSHGIRPTEQGKAFLSYARNILDNYTKITHMGKEKQITRFTLGGFSSSFSNIAFSRLCARYREDENYEMSLLPLERSVDVVFKQLQMMEMDLAMMYLGPGNQANVLEKCKTQKIKMTCIGKLPLNVYLRKSHPLLKNYDPSKPESFDFSGLSQYPYIDYRSNDMTNYTYNGFIDIFLSPPPVNRFQKIFVHDVIQKDEVCRQTNAFSIGLERAASYEKPELMKIPLYGLLADICLFEPLFLPDNPLILEYQTLLIEEFRKNPRFLPI